LPLPDLARIKRNLLAMDDWEERYAYLIGLARHVPPYPEALRDEDHRVHGCQSRVWMAFEARDGVLHVDADSDAHIVKGLIALLLAAYSDRSAAEILAVDAAGLFAELGLENHLSPTRRNGLYSMVGRVRDLARTLGPSTGA